MYNTAFVKSTNIKQTPRALCHWSET